jgi:hypothetical protein
LGDYPIEFEGGLAHPTSRCGNHLLLAFSGFFNHKSNIPKGICPVGIMVMQWVSAELPCFWVNLVPVMSQASQPIGGMLSVKVTVREYCPSGIDGVQNRHSWQDGGLVPCRPHNVIN